MAKAKKTTKNLVIVESPSKAKTIQKILGKDFLVLASYGHVADIAKGKGKGFLVEGVTDDFEVAYAPLVKKKDALKDLDEAAGTADTVFLCSDEDREGEAIAWNIFNLLGLKKSNTHRVTFHEITPKAITEAFKHPRDIDLNLVNSQQARRILDRIVGYKLSPLLWEKIKRGLSAGRVQSVAVKLLAEREQEIAAFKPDEYWTIAGSLGTSGSSGWALKPFPASLRSLDGKSIVSSAADVEKAKGGAPASWVKDEAGAKAIVEKVKDRPYVISASDVKETSRAAPPPFHTSSLQQAAATRLGFDAKRTMMVAQALYEGIDVGSGLVGLITYMRTDSFNISKDACADCEKFVKGKIGKEYHSANVFKSKKGAQEAHECIRPTYVDLEPSKIKAKLTTEQAKLYDLIWSRFVASQMAIARYDSTTIEATTSDKKAPEAVFRATGRVLKFAGWTKVYGADEDEKDVPMPVVPVGQATTLCGFPAPIAGEQHFTQPPPRYNDASLIKTMEKEGIGRPSTYASILSVIQDRKYAEKAGHGGRAPLRATDLGIVVTESLSGYFPSVMDVGFTRDMEAQLDDVEEGKVPHKNVLDAFYKDFAKEIDVAKKSMKSTKGGEETKHPCPKCGSKMFKKLGTFGFFLACPDEEACCQTMDIDEDGNPKERDLPAATGIKCEKCGKEVVQATGRFGPYLCCAGCLTKPKKECDFTLKLSKGGLPLCKVEPIKTEIECEKCKKHMLIRATRNGKAFLACSGFPRCRHGADLPDTKDMKDAADEIHKRWLAKKAKDAFYAKVFSHEPV